MDRNQMPLPKITQMSQEFWDGCKHHELRIQRCQQCRTYRFPPQIMCPKCRSIDFNWTRVKGTGKIYSYTISHMPSPGDYPFGNINFPFGIVLVELDGTGGTRIASNMVDCKLDDIKIGLGVEVVFEKINDEITLPKFKPK